jgi:hypothetical protein
LNASVWHDRGLQQTNPVHVLGRIAEDLEGHFVRDWNGAASKLADATRVLVTLPAFAVEEFKRKGYLPEHFLIPTDSARPGVLGLVVAPGSELGLVLPLRANRPRASTDGWHFAEGLPFQREQVLDALAALVAASDLPTAGVLPERLAFRFDNLLERRALGNSMTVAAVLAILNTLAGGNSEVLRCACAVVEPVPGGLHAVEHIRAKLAAVRREHRGGSLLVCAAGCLIAAEFRSDFEQVWEVSSWEDLARKLDAASLLAPLLEQAPLHGGEVQRIHERLQWLVRSAHRYTDASDLGERFVACRLAEVVSASLTDTIAGLLAESYRHQGRFVAACTASQPIHHAAHDRGPFTSYDEQASAAAEYAAALFDAHDFAAIPPLLQPWVETARQDPLRLRPETRVKVFNTLGRARVVLGVDGWQPLFRASLELQERLDPGNVLRTSSYLVHGLLRSGDVKEARRQFEQLPSLERIPGISGWMLAFLRADLARRAQEQWSATWLEEARPGEQFPGHPLGFYFQATARQPGRTDALARLDRAEAFLRQDAGDNPRNICTLFASCMALAAAARKDSPASWSEAATAIHAFLADPAAAPLQAYYAPALPSAEDHPDPAAAERLLTLIPYL